MEKEMRVILCASDLEHIRKYAAPGVRVRGGKVECSTSTVRELYSTISPVEAVDLRLEKISYLDSFGDGSIWKKAVDRFKANMGTQNGEYYVEDMKKYLE